MKTTFKYRIGTLVYTSNPSRKLKIIDKRVTTRGKEYQLQSLATGSKGWVKEFYIHRANKKRC